jgi:hypothetical protein
VRAKAGGNLPMPGAQASIIIPQGRNGPAFIAYPNFNVLFEWNQSFTYVLTAAYFATRLEGAPVIDRATRRRGSTATPCGSCSSGCRRGAMTSAPSTASSVPAPARGPPGTAAPRPARRRLADLRVAERALTGSRGAYSIKGSGPASRSSRMGNRSPSSVIRTRRPAFSTNASQRESPFTKAMQTVLSSATSKYP